MTAHQCKVSITGVILAGGQASRMGGTDKGLIKLGGKHMVEYVIEALRPQVDHLFISANRNQSYYAQLGNCSVLTDNFGHYEGPLAGMLTGLHTAQTPYVLFVPCDSPLLTPHLAWRLYSALLEAHAQVSVAEEGCRIHPLFALVQRDLVTDLLEFLNAGERKVRLWYQRHPWVKVDFSDVSETFFNVNTPQDYATLVQSV